VQLSLEVVERAFAEAWRREDFEVQPTAQAKRH
jgi:hypothetical protein